MSDLFLGIDIGTSGCKLALFDRAGEVAMRAAEPYPVYYPAPGYAEQDANDWWAAVCRALRRLWAQGADAARIAAIGIDGQSWSAIPVGFDGKVLANTPIWMDTRAADICAVWEKRLGHERLFAVSGNPFSPTYTLPKVLYWAEHEPGLLSKTAYILQSNAYMVYLLTGAVTMDYSMSYGWHNFDQQKLRYDAALSKEFGLPDRFLIEPVPSCAIVGRVSAAAAEATGLLTGIPVVAGGLDAACSTLGVGVTEPGQTQEQGGQAGGMSICLDHPKTHPKLILSPHVVPGRWLLQGGTVGGGASLKWFAEQLACKGGPVPENIFEALSAAAETAPAGSGGLLFLPYLAGERSPLWDAKAQGVYFGLKYATSYAHLVRAAMEGVAYALKHNIETAAEAGAAVSELYGTGGSANSHIWAQIKADVTGLAMRIPASDTATTCGAAMLAMVGVGAYPSCRAAVDRIVQIRRTHTPNPANAALYLHLFEIYGDLYRCTSESMHRLYDLQTTL